MLVPKKIKNLIRYGTTEHWKESRLLKCAEAGSLAGLTFLLDMGVKKHHVAQVWAAYYGHLKCLELLLCEPVSATVIIYALDGESEEVLDFLLSKKIDDSGKALVYEAINRSNSKLFNTCLSQGFTLFPHQLAVALENDELEMAKGLVEAGVTELPPEFQTAELKEKLKKLLDSI